MNGSLKKIFKKISEYGLNLVRIPFGWWILGAPPYYFSALAHLDRGVQLAQQYGINVILDLHGAPGSQNGFDNSGMACSSSQYLGYCATDFPEDPEWAWYESNINYTIWTLEQIATRYANYTNIWGIELLNEPRGDTNLTVLQTFYENAYTALRAIVPSWQIVMHDSFRPTAWVGFMNDSEHYNTTMDTHIYHVFSDLEVTQTLTEKLQDGCNSATVVQYFECCEMAVIVGEFSLAINDCAEWLDGFEKGSRTETMGRSCADVPTSSFYTAYSQSQFWSYEQGHGWIMWNFKNELENDWSYFKAAELGWVPSNASDMPSFVQGACNSSVIAGLNGLNSGFTDYNKQVFLS